MSELNALRAQEPTFRLQNALLTAGTLSTKVCGPRNGVPLCSGLL